MIGKKKTQQQPKFELFLKANKYEHVVWNFSCNLLSAKKCSTCESNLFGERKMRDLRTLSV